MRDTGFSLTAKLAASCERAEPDPGPEPGIAYFNDEAYIQTARTVLETAPEDGIWVFAYGSLLWRPAFAPHETRGTCFGLAAGILPGDLALAWQSAAARAD